MLVINVPGLGEIHVDNFPGKAHVMCHLSQPLWINKIRYITQGLIVLISCNVFVAFGIYRFNPELRPLKIHIRLVKNNIVKLNLICFMYWYQLNKILD